MKFLLYCCLLGFITEATVALVCPDGSTCPDDNTCCEVDADTYGCCPLPNAVCCDDKEHCCPNGYTCSSGMCFRGAQAPRLNSSIVCPGGKFQCPDGNTCCPAEDVFTCCPLPDATCCSDGQHCCPSGTTCDLAHETCNVPIFKIASVAVVRRARVVVCPGGQFQCPDGNTCCLLSSGEYGCCPLPNAVCCDDRIHCCPSGYTCDTGRCVQAGLATTPLPTVPVTELQDHLQIEDPNPSETSVPCPDGSGCPDGSTCCESPSGEYHCCKLPDAVCCADKVQCCPSGFQCDQHTARCHKVGEEDATPSVVPWVKKVPAQPRLPDSSTEQP